MKKTIDNYIQGIERDNAQVLVESGYTSEY